MEEAQDDEDNWKACFKDVTVTSTDQKILDLIKKDKLITPEVIATAIHVKPAYVTGD